MKPRYAFPLGVASGAAFVALAWRFKWLSDRGLAVDWSTTLQFLANVAQVVAVVVGAIWTYRLFVKQRLDRSRAELSVSADWLSRHEDHDFVRVRLQILNCGSIILKPKWATVQIHAVKRVGEPMEFPLNGGLPWRGDESPLKWPEVARIKADLQQKEQELELEPGEAERYPFDFKLPPGLEILQVHAVVDESDDKDTDWWDDTVVCTFPVAANPNA